MFAGDRKKLVASGRDRNKSQDILGSRDTAGQNGRAVGDRKHGRRCSDALSAPETQIIQEEEGLILHNRAAELRVEVR